MHSGIMTTVAVFSGLLLMVPPSIALGSAGALCLLPGTVVVAYSYLWELKWYFCVRWSVW